MRIEMALCFLTVAGTGLAQPDSNSITVTASRLVNHSAGAMNFFILISTPPEATPDQVTSALVRGGVTGANWSGYTGYRNTGALWAFDFSSPFANIKDTAGKLTAIGQSIGSKPGWSLEFQGSSVEQQGGSGCPLADLLADARVQAQQLASVAGVTAGQVLAMSDDYPNPSLTGLYAVAILGAFSTFPAQIVASSSSTFSLAYYPLPVPLPPPVVCSLTVKFSLLRY